MQILKDLKKNDREHGFYYGSWYNDTPDNVVFNQDQSEEDENGINGWAVYQVDKEGLSHWIMDGNEESRRAMALRFINAERAEYSLCEAVADIMSEVTRKRFISNGGSRLVISMVIGWAKKFEEENLGIEWGVNSELDYIDAIDQYTEIKIAESVNAGWGYIDTDIE